MQLLKKSEIAKHQADAKKMEIDEGMKIARRIDALRETLLEEEKSLEKFRTVTVSRIQAEIVEENKERDSLRNQVKILKKQREKLMAPLDEEWAKLDEEKKSFGEEKQNLKLEWENFYKQQEEVKEMKGEASKAVEEAKTLKSRAESELSYAHDNKIESDKSLARAKRLEREAEHLALSVNKDLKDRDTKLAIKERDYTIREANLLERESAIEKDWKLLEDRKATFERTINRLKQ